MSPRPLNERESLEQERAELLQKIEAWQHEAASVHPGPRRREWLDWQMQNARRRIAVVTARLEMLDDL